MAKRFFEKNKSDSCLSALKGDDCEALLRLCITSDTILIDGKSYSQKKGLAMGNNLAPTLYVIREYRTLKPISCIVGRHQKYLRPQEKSLIAQMIVKRVSLR